MLKEQEYSGIQSQTLPAHLTELQEANLSISSNLDSGSLFREIVDWACSLTNARYGALLTFNEAGENSELVTRGIDPEKAALIETVPRIGGLLSKLTASDTPIRVKDVSTHPESAGFPQHHPIMTSFLGAPIRHQGRCLANLYLADKATDPEFTAEDEAVIAAFASQAAVAMVNATKYGRALHSKSNLETLINISPVGVIVFDAVTGQMVTYNREVERIIGDAGIPNGTWEDTLKVLSFRRADGREVSLSSSPITRVLSSGEIVRAEEIVIYLPDGRAVHTLINAAPIYSMEGEVQSVIVAIQDMSPLFEMDRMRSDFLSLVGNELRTPLTTIKGSIAALADSIAASGHDESRQMLRVLDRQADAMRNHLNRLIDLTQIESGSLNISPEPLDLAPLLNEARREFLRSNAGHKIKLDVAPDLPCAMADRQRIAQVLRSLLQWGVKYSPPSSSLCIQARKDEMHVTVGISLDAQPSQAGALGEALIRSTSRWLPEANREGEEDKMAIAICQGIVNTHGGRLWVEPGLSDQGLTLGFSIPAAEEHTDQPNSAPTSFGGLPFPSHEGRKRILSVVEMPRMLNAVQRALSHAGYVPIGALDYSDLGRIIAEEKPHLALLDMGTGSHQDFDVIRRVTQQFGVPAIVLSGQGDDESIVRAFEMGADDYIAKPFSPSELVARIKVSFRKRAEAQNGRDREDYIVGDLVINYPERRVTVGGRKVHLTATEYQLLQELSTRPGRVLSQDELLRRIWGEEYTGDIQLLRAFVKTLRQKLGDNARRPTYIFTEHGVGYRMPKPQA
ncbi:MAG: winged helix-turn-helix domain-containing protein [Chloroflexota bacterium]|nr:winged helix-turn-helix domain-containing protein [Chloroflexota bacterium]